MSIRKRKLIFDIKQLECAYKNGNTVLTVNDLQIPKGKLIFVVGSSGNGKSTFLETLGLMSHTIQPGSSIQFYDDSRIEYDLFDLWKQDEKVINLFRRKHFSFIFQKTNLMPNFTCGENMIMPALFRGKSFNEAKKEILKYMELLNLPIDIFDKQTNSLSGGQQQRLAFIRALIIDFTVLFGDEPTGNLDYLTANDMLSVLKQHLHLNEKTGILVSHNLDLAIKFADVIIPILTFKSKSNISGIIKQESVIFRNSSNKFISQSDTIYDSIDYLKSIIA